MINNQICAIATLIRDEDLKQYAGDAFWNFIQSVIMKDPSSGLSSIKNVKDLVFHVPTLLFWDKMYRFLFGTYHNFGEQVKMANHFDHDFEKYKAFTKKQINLINQFEDDEKVDYFANLTRAFLFECISDIGLYFKLAKFLSLCTTEELMFVMESSHNLGSKNNAMISALYQHGLVTQAEDENGESIYVLSDFAIALKQNCLNFDDGVGETPRIQSYKQLGPLSIPEPASMGDFNDLFLEPITLNGGSASDFNQ